MFIAALLVVPRVFFSGILMFFFMSLYFIGELSFPNILQFILVQFLCTAVCRALPGVVM